MQFRVGLVLFSIGEITVYQRIATFFLFLQIDPLEKEADVVKALYDLIELYEVPTPPEDFAVYQSLGPSITRVRNAIDKSLAERDGNVDKFCVRLDKDIAELSREVKEVRGYCELTVIYSDVVVN